MCVCVCVCVCVCINEFTNSLYNNDLNVFQK